jgi:DNA-binding transcriptional LysR family regulator
VQILSDFEARSDSSLYATYMPTRYMQPKVRAFIDHLIEHFGPEPDWDRF